MNSKNCRCVIIGGANILNYNFIKSVLKKNDYFICCDSGMKHIKKLGIIPNLVIGDFDSYKKPKINVPIITLPCEKDDTDTNYAVKCAIKNGFNDFLLIGVIGNRLDHTLANISIMLMLDKKNKNVCAIDDYSIIEIVSDKKKYITDEFSYFSIINVFGIANGIIIKNAKYLLNNSSITKYFQYGISNEVIKGKIAEVSIKKGKALLIKVF